MNRSSSWIYSLSCPFYITLRDHDLFGFAGLWERWEHEERVLESCSIITTSAIELTAPIHARMPVILPPDAYDPWLDTSHHDGEARSRLLAPSIGSHGRLPRQHNRQ
jgi:putative SOS response-associated peptidase YedK